MWLNALEGIVNQMSGCFVKVTVLAGLTVPQRENDIKKLKR